MTLEFSKEMKEALSVIGLDLSDKQMESFYIFYQELLRVNEYMNLTAITDMKDVIYKHFVDSLSIYGYIDGLSENKFRVLDLGTGAGFPGLPLAIAFPNLELLLLDSLNKRIRFINDVASKLGLSNVRALHSRAEDLAKDKNYRESFDLVLSRAVANLSTLSELCIPFLRINANFCSYKSAKVDDELETSKKAIKLLGAELEKIENFRIADAGRSIVFIKKIRTTDKKYPRKAGLPAKEPL